MQVLETDHLRVPAPVRVTHYIFISSLLSTLRTELNKALYVEFGEGNRSIISCNDGNVESHSGDIGQHLSRRWAGKASREILEIPLEPNFQGQIRVI